MKRSGFTLIELMAVLAIAAILVVLTYPSYASYVRKARRTEGQVALLDAMQRQERYYADHNRYQPFSADSDDGDAHFRWWSGRSARESAYELHAQACAGQALSRCIEVHAVPGTDRVDRRFDDSECATLILTSSGAHRASGQGTRCWP